VIGSENNSQTDSALYIRQAEMELECPMPIALRAPSRSIHIALCAPSRILPAPILPAPTDMLYIKTVGATRHSGTLHSVRNMALLVCLWQVCLHLKTWIKGWFSSQKWLLLTKDPAVVLHTDGTRMHAKFRHPTLRCFRGYSKQTYKSNLKLYID